MARTYREIAIEDMVLTVEEAMSRVLDWWGDLPPSMKEAIEQFRIELGAAIDSVEMVKKALNNARTRQRGRFCPKLIRSSAARADPRGPAAEVADTAVGKGVPAGDKHDLGQHYT